VVHGSANATVVLADESGRIEVNVKDGHRTLLATNAQGETVFDGPIDTAEQLSTVPEDLRKQVEAIEARMQAGVANTPASSAPAADKSAQSDLADVGAL